MDVFFKTGRVREVNRLVQLFHYSHRPYPRRTIALCASWHVGGQGFLQDEGPPIAGVLFAESTARWKERVLELVRLVREDGVECPPLSGLVSKAVKEIRKRGLCDLLVSFADSERDHHGGVYQACSWDYHGIRNSTCDGFFLGNLFLPRRSCNAIYKTSSVSKLTAILAKKHGIVPVPHYDVGKHLYWKALNKGGLKKARRLKLEANPYPKPKR